MALTNSLKQYEKDETPKTFSAYLVPKKTNIEGILGKERTVRFISSITSAIASTPTLATCEHYSLLSGALLGESLGLCHSPQLGQYYLVPFKKRFLKDGKWQETTLAQFILGVKGWKQLAIRSGQYETLDVIEIREGEYKGRDKWSGEPIFEFIENDIERNSKKVIGYLAYFKLLNGFSKRLYRTKEEMLDHADRYSQAFSRYGEKTNKYTKVSYEEFLKNYDKLKDDRLYSSFWYKDFDAMAKGKVIKKLIQDYGVLSVDLQDAISKDDKLIEDYETNDDGVLQVNALEVENTTKYDKIAETEEIVEQDEKTDLKATESLETTKKTKSSKNKEETVVETDEDNEQAVFGIDDFFQN